MHANLQDKTWYGDGVPTGVMDNPVPRGGIYVNIGSGFAYVNNGTLESPNYVPVGAGGGGGSFNPSAITESMLPDDGDTYDLGSQAKRWKEGWLSDFVAIGDAPAQSGEVRMSSVGKLVWRRVGDNGDRVFVELDQDLESWQLDPDGCDVIMGAGSSLKIINGSDFVVDGINSGITVTPFTSGGMFSVSDDTILLNAPYVIAEFLPTVDPEIAGHLYEDPITHAVTVSQGA